VTPSERDAMSAYSARCGEREAMRAHLRAADEHAEDAAQVQALIDHGRCQEANEKSFCKGMLVGGAVALTVLVVTLRLTGVI